MSRRENSDDVRIRAALRAVRRTVNRSCATLRRLNVSGKCSNERSCIVTITGRCENHGELYRMRSTKQRWRRELFEGGRRMITSGQCGRSRQNATFDEYVK